jgi:hypothetical protein
MNTGYFRAAFKISFYISSKKTILTDGESALH